jgi:hypothetical protein
LLQLIFALGIMPDDRGNNTKDKHDKKCIHYLVIQEFFPNFHVVLLRQLSFSCRAFFRRIKLHIHNCRHAQTRERGRFFFVKAVRIRMPRFSGL